MGGQQCVHCGSTDQAHTQSKWCVPYENWLILGRLEFLAPVLTNPDQFLQSPPPSDPSLIARERGKKSCVILLAAWITELALKTLLVSEGHRVEKGDAWGHDLWCLYDALRCETKKELRSIHGTELPDPYRNWTEGDCVEDIVLAAKDTFVIWRYLSSKSEIKSEPKKLVTVAYAAYMLHLKRTKLPTWPSV